MPVTLAFPMPALSARCATAGRNFLAWLAAVVVVVVVEKEVEDS